MRTVALLSLSLCIAPIAHAGEGRLEINQACVATGCFPGDSGGYPVQIPDGKSVVMTSDLALPDSSTFGISAGADVALDMNGFSIVGVTSCTGVPAACTGQGSGYGVTMGARSSLRNGAVRRAGSTGVFLADAGVVENVTIAENGGHGFTANGKGQQILGCRILQNRQSGIQLYYGSSYGALIRGNTIYGNGQEGAQVNGAQVLENVFTHNADEGLYGAGGTGYWGNKFGENNGGNANAQVGIGSNLGANVCGTSVCP